ncbi:MAG TPA: winged helix-turn-helix domain-containing protein [Solirubrobacteraceae bacterium]|nr:winged helix-turn-helix domain-containing protein [Solirubrobacteraceae bacterium]
MAIELLHDPDRVRLALTPIRRTLLDLLQHPASATQLATQLNLPRQRINYHLRVLERAGLVELVEERQRRGCTERIVVAAADAFVVDPAVLGERQTTQDRFAAAHLINTAANLVRDVARQQAEAQHEGTRLLTFTLETEVGFATPQDLERFTEDLAEALATTAARYDAPGRRYRVVAGGHPAPRTETA